jgi:hypothetical protein
MGGAFDLIRIKHLLPRNDWQCTQAAPDPPNTGVTKATKSKRPEALLLPAFLVSGGA